MQTSTIIIVFIFGLIIFISLFILNFINRLIFYRKKVTSKFSSIQDLINEKTTIIAQIIEFLEINCPHEDNIIKRLKSITTTIQNTKDINELLSLLEKSDNYLNNALNLESTYITLKDNKKYQQLKTSIKDNYDRIIFSSSVYNEEVTNYNNFKNSNKFIHLIANLFKFKDYNYYKK